MTHVLVRQVRGRIQKKPLQSVVVFQSDRALRFDGNIVALPYREFLSDLLPSVAAA